MSYRSGMATWERGQCGGLGDPVWSRSGVAAGPGLREEFQVTSKERGLCPVSVHRLGGGGSPGTIPPEEDRTALPERKGQREPSWAQSSVSICVLSLIPCPPDLTLEGTQQVPARQRDQSVASP